MSALTDYLENKLIDHVLRGQAYTKPTTVYMALFTSATTDAGGGTELSGNNYARVAITCSLANFVATQGVTSPLAASSGTGGATSNGALVQFNEPSAAWGTVTHWALYDAETTGNMLFHGALSSSKTIAAGDDVAFVANALQITWA